VLARKLPVRLGLFVLAFVLAAAIVFVGNAATDIVLGEAVFGDDSVGSISAVDVLVLHLLATGLPFYALAAVGEARVSVWIVAAGLTIATWVYAVWQIWNDSLSNFAGGANIGLGLIMTGAPVLIAIVVVAYSMVTTKQYD
jgi:hypothetical protein